MGYLEGGSAPCGAARMLRRLGGPKPTRPAVETGRQPEVGHGTAEEPVLPDASLGFLPGNNRIPRKGLPGDGGRSCNSPRVQARRQATRHGPPCILSDAAGHRASPGARRGGPIPPPNGTVERSRCKQAGPAGGPRQPPPDTQLPVFSPPAGLPLASPAARPGWSRAAIRLLPILLSLGHERCPVYL